jgi:hypothetical protein
MLLCPKCKQVIIIIDDKDYVICCNEVIYVNAPIVQRIELEFPKF